MAGDIRKGGDAMAESLRVLSPKGEMKGEYERKPKITLVFIEEGIQG